MSCGAITWRKMAPPPAESRRLRSGVARVGGYDVPYPANRLEEHFLPGVDRVLDAIDRALDW